MARASNLKFAFGLADGIGPGVELQVLISSCGKYRKQFPRPHEGCCIHDVLNKTDSRVTQVAKANLA